MVALEIADPQLLVVALHLKDPDVVVLDDREIRLALARQMDAEPLFGHRMAIFQTSPGHCIAGNPGRIGQQASHPGGILASFAYPDEDVFPLAARCKPEIFIDHEVGGLGLEDAASSGRPVQIGKLFQASLFHQQDDGFGGDPFLAPRESELFGGGRLDVHPVQITLQIRGQHGAHGVDMGPSWGLGDDGHIQVADGITCALHAGKDIPQQDAAVDALEFG